MTRKLDLTGQKFERLLVTQRVAGRRRTAWLCICDCGNTATVDTGNLTSNHTRSCGCLKVDATKLKNTTHGHSTGYKATTEYMAFCRAKKRCTNVNTHNYHYYGGRGIQFKFQSFKEFYKEVGPKPSTSHSLDRKDNNGHYEPGNVRWATKSEQMINRRPFKRNRQKLTLPLAA